MKQKTINLYQFEEITEEQQAQVIEKYRDINDDTLVLYADDELCMQEIWESGFIDAKPCYDLIYSQGGGACFNCDEFDFDLLLKDWEHKHKNWIVNIIKEHYQGYIKENRYANFYSHSKTRYFELEANFNYLYLHIERAINSAIAHIENLRYELAESLTNRLYEQLEWFRSDEQIKDTLIANEYYFNGETLKIEE